jgi:hypothetical protein
MSAQPKRGRGRPLKPAAARKRNNLTIRVRDALKANLESRAQENQRSLSEEAEFRLEGSFADQGYLEQMQEQLGGATTYALLMILGRVMRETGITARLMSPPTDKQDVNDWHRHPAGTATTGRGNATT